MKRLSHINHSGDATMVDVSGKENTIRFAKAQAVVHLPKEVFEELDRVSFETKKCSVFQTAIIAGIMGAKKTHELIPLCHPLLTEKVSISIEKLEGKILIICEAKITGKTGVEMEALTGASIAALTIYDMCKAMSHHITISDLKLLEKTGGKMDFISTK